MSEGAFGSIEFAAANPLPKLHALVADDPSAGEWIAAQQFHCEQLCVKKVIRLLREKAECKGFPFFAKRGELRSVHRGEEGDIVARIIDVTIGAGDGSAKICLAPDNDPRVVALQREVNARRGNAQ